MACLYLDIDFIISINRTFLSPLASLSLFSTPFSEEEKKIEHFFHQVGAYFFIKATF